MVNSAKSKSSLTLHTLRTSRPYFSALYRSFVARKRSLLFRLLSVYLFPFSLVYSCVVILKGVLSRPRSFRATVISVGNITAGGAGKTPLVMLIAEAMIKQGKKTAIVTSGAGAPAATYVCHCEERSDEAISPVVIPASSFPVIPADSKRESIFSFPPLPWRERAGVRGHPNSLGDEPTMLLNRLPGVFIVKGRNKTRLVEIAEKQIAPDVVIIDDGFHCRGIKKDLDILVLDGTAPFDNGLTLPSGLLREPAFAARRADIYVINRGVESSLSGTHISRLTSHVSRVFFMDYEIEALRGPSGDLPVSALENKKILAFAGLGNPMGFFAALEQCRPREIHGVIYPDHFAYRDYDAAEIRRLFQDTGAEMLVTTEKDLVKIKDLFPGLPLYALAIRPRLVDRAGLPQKI